MGVVLSLVARITSTARTRSARDAKVGWSTACVSDRNTKPRLSALYCNNPHAARLGNVPARLAQVPGPVQYWGHRRSRLVRKVSCVGGHFGLP